MKVLYILIWHVPILKCQRFNLSYMHFKNMLHTATQVQRYCYPYSSLRCVQSCTQTVAKQVSLRTQLCLICVATADVTLSVNSIDKTLRNSCATRSCHSRAHKVLEPRFVIRSECSLATRAWYRVCHLKNNITTITYYGTKISQADPPPVISSHTLPHVTRVKVSLIALPLLTLVARRCSGVNMVYSWAERLLIPELYFASKSFAAVREAFSNAYPDKEVPNKTTVHRLVTKFRDTGSVCLWQVLIEWQNSWNYGRTECKQWISNSGIRLQ
jgi:hypothetical protein